MNELAQLLGIAGALALPVVVFLAALARLDRRDERARKAEEEAAAKRDAELVAGFFAEARRAADRNAEKVAEMARKFMG